MRPVPRVVIGTALLAVAAAAPARADSVVADFNGDGRGDLAIGAPREDLGSRPDAGAVHVIYGSSGGLTASGSDLWHYDAISGETTAEAGDHFGSALAAADFDGDGHSELAIGAPNERADGVDSGGTVHVLQGSATGLVRGGHQLFTQDSGDETTGDSFGRVLATGDFNGDGSPDLAVGMPQKDIGSHGFAGALHVLYSSSIGLVATGRQVWHQDSAGVEGAVESNDYFAGALAAGDFDGDDDDELAIGVPREDHSGLLDPGVINVLRGSPSGLTASGDQLWHQDTAGIKEAAESRDRFGERLAAGTFNPGDEADLAVGVPAEALGGRSNAGVVQVIHGSAAGLADSDQLWTQDSPNVAEVAEPGDDFGWSLAVGDFDGNLDDDLAVGARDEGTESIPNFGVVQVLYGSSLGISGGDRDQLWRQSSLPTEQLEADDRFGHTLTAGDFNGPGSRWDLAVGVPFEALGSSRQVGIVNVIYGSASGLSVSGAERWSQASSGIAGTPESFDFFGGSLVANG